MLDRLTLKNFTVFKDVELAFTPGINVLIGANGTGKTHAMKAAYALLKTIPKFERKRDSKAEGVLVYHNAEKLAAVFRSSGHLRPVVRRNSRSASISVNVNGQSLTYKISGDLISTRNDPVSHEPLPVSLFIPAREVLSIYPGFIAAYQSRELSFDETYYDICVALSALPLRGPRGEEAAALWEPLAASVGAKVALKNDSFYLTSEDGEIAASLAAEGYRKVAALIHLIANGSLAKNTILFWDEPETNLNPKLIKIVADFLFKLAENGVQIILATHDYLLTNELSLNAEYQTDAAKKAPIRFFSFYRDEDRSVSVEHGETLVDLTHNPIMEEFAALYERERRLFSTPDVKSEAQGKS